MLPKFVEDTCLPYLLNAQNADGGWGFKVGAASRAEPTAWALLALADCGPDHFHEQDRSRAIQFLSATQLSDGSWSSSPDVSEGCWVTSLACWALLGQTDQTDRVTRGLQWLCAGVPGEAKPLRRLVRNLMPKRTVATQNDAYYGWSWTPGTASWVEPTSYVLILLRQASAISQPANASRRSQLAVSMLIDRMCPGGGWNCGNPMVYGVAGEPQVGPTVWALLALRDEPQRPEVQRSLQWLEGYRRSIRSPGSLALAHIAMSTLGAPDMRLPDSLSEMYRQRDVLWSTPEIAWSALALSGTSRWLDRKSNPNKPRGTSD